MARGFGATVGTGTTDSLHAVGAKVVPSLFSISLWIQNIDTTASRAQRLFSYQTSGSNMVMECFYGSTDERLYFQVDFTTTNAEWSTEAQRNVVPDNWTHLVITYDTTHVNRNPIIYIDGVAHTVGGSSPLDLDENSTPFGVFTNNAADFRIGNRRDGTRVQDGHFMDVAIWSGALLNQTNVDLLRTGDVSPDDITQTSLVQEYYWPLTGDLLDDWGSATFTAIGPPVVQGNPLFMHNVWVDAVSGSTLPIFDYHMRQMRANNA